MFRLALLVQRYLTMAVHATTDARGGGCVSVSVTLLFVLVSLTYFTSFAMTESVYSLYSCSEGLEGGQRPLEPWPDGLSGSSEVHNITLTVQPEVMEGYVEGVGLHEARGEPQHTGMQCCIGCSG